jgi:glycosyltransferase involved in cell wall biosynthesis
MPVYNGSRYLGAAIESILTQTYTDFVFFIIDDGSQDNSYEIISKYAARDSRIQHFRQPNAGLITTLNRYFSKVETEFIARMDCDDISLPDRFAKQVSFLESHPDVGIVGSAVRHMNESLNEVIEEAVFPDTHVKILWKMLYTSGFSHPATMFRNEVVKKIGTYAENAKHVEDYDLFLRAKDVTNLANLRQTLLIYRNHNSSVSAQYMDLQRETHFLLSARYFKQLGLPYVEEDAIRFLKSHVTASGSSHTKIYSFLKLAYKKFITRYDPSPSEKNYIYRDLYKHLSVLAISYKNVSFYKGLLMYLKTVLKAPWLIAHNLNNRSR